ncbi:E3 ISG15-protein ligase Herc6 [Smittium culicis]|uniref:E3 ISG15-protein ligase Herc6 n=1 Tax=Smittium culicis TaxID=133412 RepID=A0A1R1XBH8_9FUNG|nr:E3 ISG15-protein ligase Herc6 [Smittium culicis]
MVQTLSKIDFSDDIETSALLSDVIIDKVLDAAYCVSESCIYAIVSIPKQRQLQHSGSSARSMIVSMKCTPAAGAEPRNSSLGNCVPDIVDINIDDFVIRLDRLDNNNPVSIDAGYSHVVACCSDGQVYSTFTSNIKNVGGKSGAFVLLDSLAGIRICQIRCGQFHTLFVDADGFLFSCGLNNYGQLGRTNPSETLPDAQNGTSLDNGWSSDSNQNGFCARLGPPQPPTTPADDAVIASDYTVPEPVTEFMKFGSAVDPVVTDIACGTYHSVINTDMGVFSCGDGNQRSI